VDVWEVSPADEDLVNKHKAKTGSSLSFEQLPSRVKTKIAVQKLRSNSYLIVEGFVIVVKRLVKHDAKYKIR
jgi:hypothetical protein